MGRVDYFSFWSPPWPFSVVHILHMVFTAEEDAAEDDQRCIGSYTGGSNGGRGAAQEDAAEEDAMAPPGVLSRNA